MPQRKVGRPPLSSNGSSQSATTEAPGAVAEAPPAAAAGDGPTVDLDAVATLHEATDATDVDVDLTASPPEGAGQSEEEPKRGGLLGRLFSRKR